MNEKFTSKLKEKHFFDKTVDFSYHFLPFYFVMMADTITIISQNKK